MTAVRYTTNFHSIEAEQGVLGAILINNEAMALVEPILDAGDFFEPLHGKIYEISRDLIRAGRPATPITLKSFLDPAQQFGPSGATVGQYVAHLAAEAVTVINAPDFAKVIRDHADVRRCAEVGANLQAAGGLEPVELATQAIDYLDQIVARRASTSSPSVDMGEATVRAVDDISGAYQRDGAISGITWGLQDLDRKTLGLQRGELAILAGRPGMGKTALGLSILRKTAMQGNRAMLFSHEMGDVSVTQRMIADETFDMVPGGIPYFRMRSGRIKEAEFETITTAAKRLERLNIRIDQRAGLTVSQITASARQHKRRRGLDLVVIDHLHLIRASKRYAGNKVYELGEITSGLKALAKELNVSVLLLCQLSRATEARDDKRPNLSDLKGSGDIEQDADVVVMLYRERYYLERQRPPESEPEAYGRWLARMEASGNLLEAFIEKQRSGPIGRVKLFCNIACNAVRDHADVGADEEENLQKELL